MSTEKKWGRVTLPDPQDFTVWEQDSDRKVVIEARKPERAAEIYGERYITKECEVFVTVQGRDGTVTEFEVVVELEVKATAMRL